MSSVITTDDALTNFWLTFLIRRIIPQSVIIPAQIIEEAKIESKQLVPLPLLSVQRDGEVWFKCLFYFTIISSSLSVCCFFLVSSPKGKSTHLALLIYIYFLCNKSRYIVHENCMLFTTCTLFCIAVLSWHNTSSLQAFVFGLVGGGDVSFLLYSLQLIQSFAFFLFVVTIGFFWQIYI